MVASHNIIKEKKILNKKHEIKEKFWYYGSRVGETHILVPYRNRIDM